MLEQIKNFSNKPTLLATVNNIKNLDQAVIRPGRFDDIIEFSPPDKLDRAEFIKKYSEKLGTPMKKTQINKLVVATDGMTQAYLKEYCLQFSIEGNVDKIIEKIKRRRVYLDLTNPESYVDNNNDDGDIEMD
jgi:ATP-dependent 26S proteasome regulatory subunit